MRSILAVIASIGLAACVSSVPTPPAPNRWDLSTGSSVAYLHIAARGDRSHAAPIVVLHGGPGAYVVSLQATTSVLSLLSESGRDVYFYDQVGSGLSERLNDITEYTVARHVADLEAIRMEIGAEQLVLLGSSWGATLAAQYAARYPARVESMIFSGPGVIYPGDWPTGYGRVDERFDEDERARFEAAVNVPQLEAAMEVWASDPNAAAGLFPDAAAGAFFDRITNEFYLPHLGCDGANLGIVSDGYGFWANRMTGHDLNRVEDPKPHLAQSATPVLILRGECEYMHRAVAEQYLAVFRNSTLVEIQGAGHMIYWEQPDDFLRAVVAFLRP